MAVIFGKDIIIYNNSTAIASSRSCTIDVEGGTLEVSSASDGEWTHRKVDRKSWQVTLSVLVATTQNFDHLLDVGTTYTLGIAGPSGVTSDPTLQGSAICTRCSITATKGNIAQGSFVFEGSGPLTKIH